MFDPIWLSQLFVKAWFDLFIGPYDESKVIVIDFQESLQRIWFPSGSEKLDWVEM
jgi:hypothetical protein